MDLRLETELKNATESLMEACELAKMYGQGDYKPETFLNLLKDIMVIKEDAIKRQTMLDTAKVCTFRAEIDEICGNIPDPKSINHEIPKNKQYKELAKKIKDIFETPEEIPGGRLEDEDMIMESDVNLVDPLTKQPIKNPVRNKHCGHIYDADTIKSALKINRNLRCPVAGCGRRQPLSEKDLHVAHDLRQRIAEMEME